MLFVHGYNSSFESAALTMGGCHFLGRDFVCGIFTWPAGDGAAHCSATTSTASQPNTRWRTCEVIRIVARTPGVERIHLIAHSRGTDTVASALAELSVEAY